MLCVLLVRCDVMRQDQSVARDRCEGGVKKLRIDEIVQMPVLLSAYLIAGRECKKEGALTGRGRQARRAPSSKLRARGSKRRCPHICVMERSIRRHYSRIDSLTL